MARRARKSRGNKHDSQKEPSRRRRLKRGRQFNKNERPEYPYKEFYIEKPNGAGYWVLDSYSPFRGEIVSRKRTQLSEIKPESAIGYLREVAAKYAPGRRIADVPSSHGLAGTTLRGKPILEVPVQFKRVPKPILDAAKRLGIIIRDTNNKVYE